MAQLTTKRSHSVVRPKTTGTPAYIAPELCTSDAPNPGKVGTSAANPQPDGLWTRPTIFPVSDIYSLGVALVTARSPFMEWGKVPSPVRFAGGQESMREAAEKGLVSRQVLEWMQEVLHDRPALVKIHGVIKIIVPSKRIALAMLSTHIQCNFHVERGATIRPLQFVFSQIWIPSSSRPVFASSGLYSTVRPVTWESDIT